VAEHEKELETPGISMDRILKTISDVSEANQQISREYGTLPSPIITL
jgi:hypothetical protein